jgi:hypothetical protein
VRATPFIAASRPADLDVVAVAHLDGATLFAARARACARVDVRVASDQRAAEEHAGKETPHDLAVHHPLKIVDVLAPVNDFSA